MLHRLTPTEACTSRSIRVSGFAAACVTPQACMHWRLWCNRFSTVGTGSCMPNRRHLHAPSMRFEPASLVL